MTNQNIVLALLVAFIALGVFYMLDPTFGGLLKLKKEGFENNNNEVVMSTDPASVGNNRNMFANGNADANEIHSNENIANNNNTNNNVNEGFQSVSPSPADFVPAEKPKNCYPKNQLAPQELLPNDPNSKWAQVNPMGAGDIAGKNFLNAGSLIGVNTVGQSLRNASWDLRSEPPNPQVQVSPWMQSTIEPELQRRPLEIA